MNKKLFFKYSIICSLIIISINVFLCIGAIFGANTRYNIIYTIPNKNSEYIQQHISQQIYANDSSNNLTTIKSNYFNNKYSFVNNVYLNDLDFGFNIDIQEDSIVLISNFIFGEKFKSSNKLQIDSCYFITDYNIGFDEYMLISNAIEKILFGNTIEFKNNLIFYDITTGNREIDAKSWYRERDIWLSPLYKPHLTIIFPLIILIIIGSPFIYFFNKKHT